MKVLVACEFSGIVRDAFLRRGHDAWSCDLEPSESDYFSTTPKFDSRGRHFTGDIFECLAEFPSFDLVIAHPPCTYLAVSGARWNVTPERRKKQADAVYFATSLFRAAATGGARVALENPIGRLSTAWRKPDQIIQPWQFGHGETKATCLWLHRLPPLVPTKIVKGREARIHRMPPGPNRSKERSRFYTGIADAMAEQWGSL